MRETAMHKHVSKKLEEPEVVGQHKVQTKHVGKINAHHLKRYCNKVAQCVDDKQIASYCGYIAHNIYISLFNAKLRKISVFIGKTRLQSSFFHYFTHFFLFFI